MKQVIVPGWVFYRSEDAPLYDPDLVGKWMYFWADRDRVDELCSSAVEQGVVRSAKYSDADNGVACFYGHIDDEDYHRRVIEFFIKNDMIAKTKSGSFYNISFKLDAQTLAGEYGSDFSGKLKLASLVDLATGEWL